MPAFGAGLVERLRAAADELNSMRCSEDAALMREAADVIERHESVRAVKEPVLEATTVLQ